MADQVSLGYGLDLGQICTAIIQRIWDRPAAIRMRPWATTSANSRNFPPGQALSRNGARMAQRRTGSVSTTILRTVTRLRLIDRFRHLRLLRDGNLRIYRRRLRWSSPKVTFAKTMPTRGPLRLEFGLDRVTRSARLIRSAPLMSLSMPASRFDPATGVPRPPRPPTPINI